MRVYPKDERDHGTFFALIKTYEIRMDDGLIASDYFNDPNAVAGNFRSTFKMIDPSSAQEAAIAQCPGNPTENYSLRLESPGEDYQGSPAHRAVIVSSDIFSNDIQHHPMRYEIRIKVLNESGPYPEHPDPNYIPANWTYCRGIFGFSDGGPIWGWGMNYASEFIRFTENNNVTYLIALDTQEEIGSFSYDTWYQIRYQYIEPDTLDQDLRIHYWVEDLSGNVVALKDCIIKHKDEWTWQTGGLANTTLQCDKGVAWFDDYEVYDLHDVPLNYIFYPTPAVREEK